MFAIYDDDEGEDVDDECRSTSLYMHLLKSRLTHIETLDMRRALGQNLKEGCDPSREKGCATVCSLPLESLAYTWGEERKEA